MALALGQPWGRDWRESAASIAASPPALTLWYTCKVEAHLASIPVPFLQFSCKQGGKGSEPNDHFWCAAALSCAQLPSCAQLRSAACRLPAWRCRRHRCGARYGDRSCWLILFISPERPHLAATGNVVVANELGQRLHSAVEQRAAHTECLSAGRGKMVRWSQEGSLSAGACCGRQL